MESRREFLKSVAAFGAALPLASARAAETPSNLRVGILSDIHVTAPANAGFFEKALRLFDAAKADAVLVTGDLTTWNKRKEFEAVAETWYRVFPEDRRSDGGRVEKLFLTGNHDVDGFAYAGAKYASLEEARPESFFFHREQFWRELFHEDYAPVVMKTVKGYAFILRNWISTRRDRNAPWAKGFADEPDPVPAFLEQVAPTLPKERPFFYAQHPPLGGTVNMPWLHGVGVPFDNGQDDGTNTKALARFPNCMAFTGHSHSSLTDETSIWQGAFTAVNAGCARGYAFSPPGRENGFSCCDFNRRPPFEMAKFDHASVRHGLLMDVFDDRIELARLDLTYDCSLGANWVVPLENGRTVPATGVPPFDPTRRARAARAPAFAPSDRVTVGEIAQGHRRTAVGTGALDRTETHAQVKVTFPPITTKTSPSRGFDFSVRAEMRIGDVCQCLGEKRVLSPNAFQGEARDVEPVTCLFAKSDFPDKREIRFVVTPYDCWGNPGAPILSNWTKLA